MIIIALFYLRTSIVRAGSGKSAVASAAYQSAEKGLYSERLGQTFSYSSKEEVVFSEVLLPENAPDEYHNRQALWNAVEAKENRSNSRYARQFVIATPKEWNEQETIERSREFIQQALVSKGMCVDWAFHRKENNPHIHIMATVRGFNQDGSWAQMEKKVFALDENGERIPEIDPKTGEQKVRTRTRNGVTSSEKLWKRITVQINNWNQRSFLNEVKREWAETCNRYLEPEQHLDHRSYQEQGVNKVSLLHESLEDRAARRNRILTATAQENENRRRANAVLSQMEVFAKQARELLEKFRKQIEKWRIKHGRQRNITGITNNAGNENVNRGIRAAAAGGVGSIGEDRAGIIQHLADTAAELKQQTQKIHRRHRHR